MLSPVGDGTLTAPPPCLAPPPIFPAPGSGILGARLFGQLPRGATVVNVARGRHLVEKDLLSALDAGQVSFMLCTLRCA